jgi:hypothetical protein
MHGMNIKLKTYFCLRRIMVSTFVVISHGEVIRPVTDVFQLKSPWYVVQLCFEYELILLCDVKLCVVGLSGA